MSVNNLPEEILVKIFSYYVETERLQPLVVNLAKVCERWCRASRNLSLWTVIDEPNFRRHKLRELSKSGQLSHARILNLSYVSETSGVADLEVIVSGCPMLRKLDLSSWQLIRRNLKFLPQKCPELESLTIQNIQIKFLPFITTVLSEWKATIKYLNLSRNYLSGNVVAAIAANCPNLEELHLTDIRGPGILFPTCKVQTGCPKLRVLAIGPAEYSFKNMSMSPVFPHLETFLAGVADHRGLRDEELIHLLKSSTKLKHLDVRGCPVTCNGLFQIPSSKVESLYLSRSHAATSTELGSVICKWKDSLKDLDISRIQHYNILHALILSYLHSNPNPCLEELNLSGTAVTPDVVKTLLRKCTKLHYLNLESCREFPMGTKRIYRSSEEIKACLDIIEKRSS